MIKTDFSAFLSLAKNYNETKQPKFPRIYILSALNICMEPSLRQGAKSLSGSRKDEERPCGKQASEASDLSVLVP